MRLCTREEDLLPLYKQAQQEAEAAFGNGAVYMERFVQNPRHIEFQVGGGVCVWRGGRGAFSGGGQGRQEGCVEIAGDCCGADPEK